MKSLNIKIPLSIVQSLRDNAHLNPNYITKFINAHLHKTDSVLEKPIKELTYTYTFKVPEDLHRAVKLVSVDKGVPMNELIGRLLAYEYKR